jgi:hypothetical protein
MGIATPAAHGSGFPETVSPLLLPTYRQLGGRGILGPALSGLTHRGGIPIQFFRYGALAIENGAPRLAPVGTAALYARGWLPAAGAPDAYPPTVSADLVSELVDR